MYQMLNDERRRGFLYHSKHHASQATCSAFASLFAFQSFTAARIASSANIEQCNFTGGNFKCAAISVFLIDRTSSTCLPLTHSVATDEEAIAEPQPKVLNFDSWMLPSLSTLIWSCVRGAWKNGMCETSTESEIGILECMRSVLLQGA